MIRRVEVEGNWVPTRSVEGFHQRPTALIDESSFSKKDDIIDEFPNTRGRLMNRDNHSMPFARHRVHLAGISLEVLHQIQRRLRVETGRSWMGYRTWYVQNMG